MACGMLLSMAHSSVPAAVLQLRRRQRGRATDTTSKCTSKADKDCQNASDLSIFGVILNDLDKSQTVRTATAWQ